MQAFCIKVCWHWNKFNKKSIEKDCVLNLTQISTYINITTLSILTDGPERPGSPAAPGGPIFPCTQLKLSQKEAIIICHNWP